MAKSKEKTNVMRILEQRKIEYNAYSYEGDGTLSGEEVAILIGKDKHTVFKTLVTQGKSSAYYVFVLPVSLELDLKKAGKVTNEKSIQMIKSKDLLKVTGYIHGGCSPIGMRKHFPTFFHQSIAEIERITFSAGKIGHQVEVRVSDLHKVCSYKVEDLCMD